MRRTTSALFLVTCLVTVVVMCLGEEFTNVAGLFEIAIGARPLGMGEAYVAVADDESALFHNPAGLAFVKQLSVSSSIARQFGAVNAGIVGIAIPSFGLAVAQLDSGVISSGDEPFRYLAQGGILSTGVGIGDVSVGGSWKIYRVVAPSGGIGWAMDPGILIRTRYLSVGARWNNAIAVPIVYESGHEEEWPMTLDLGVALVTRVYGIDWRVACDAEGVLGDSTRIALGIEGWLHGVAVRMGYCTGSITVGTSARFENFQVDWAYSLEESLVGCQQVSIAFRF